MATLQRTPTTTADSLSKKLKPKELKKLKIYRLCNMVDIDRGAMNLDTGQYERPVNPVFILDGTTTIYDKHEEEISQRTKILRNVTSVRPTMKDGASVLEEIVEPVTFIEGSLIIQPSQYNTYAFLERHDGNKANPYRDKSKRVIFEPIEDEKEAADILQQTGMELNARAKALSMPMDECRAVAQTLGIVNYAGKNSEDLRIDLDLKAKQNPRAFIMATRDVEAKVKIQVKDLQVLGVIKCNANSNSWLWNLSAGKFKDNELILSYPATDNPEEALVKFIIEGPKEAKEAYQVFGEILKNPEDYIG
jgi:hypothetical protein